MFSYIRNIPVLPDGVGRFTGRVGHTQFVQVLAASGDSSPLEYLRAMSSDFVVLHAFIYEQDSNRQMGLLDSLDWLGNTLCVYGNPWFPIGHGHSKLGARKYYLHSPQPESGRCGLLVILLEWKIRGNPEKYVGSLSEAPEKCA